MSEVSFSQTNKQTKLKEKSFLNLRSLKEERLLVSSTYIIVANDSNVSPNCHIHNIHSL